MNQLNHFSNKHPWDRNYFLTILIIIWIAIITGFTYDLMTYQKAHGFNFPFIVHIHAAAYVGWLLLFTVQIILIRKNNIRLHKKLGITGSILIPVMLILGVMTAIKTETIKFGTADANTPFLSVMFGDMVVFGSLAAAGLYYRRSPAAHKRLILIATIAIADAGFGRGFSNIVAPLFGNFYWTYHHFSEGAVPYIAFQLSGPLLLILSLGIYDLITRKKLHPVYLPAVIVWLSINMIAGWLYFSEAWLKIATQLVGH